jgi:cystathionine gamma-lyase
MAIIMKDLAFDLDENICTHYADRPEDYLGAVTPPIYATSLHVFESVEAMSLPGLNGKPRYSYARSGNPSVEQFEQRIAALERAEAAVAFGSGSGAIASVIYSFVSSGDHMIVSENAYWTVRACADQLARFHVSLTVVPDWDLDAIERAITPKTKLIYIESPSSLWFVLQDLEGVAAIAKKHNIITAIDNTWATPIYQKPITWGIDLTLHSVSKYIGGHSDLIGGVVSGSAALVDRLKNMRTIWGALMSPFDAFLSTRGLRTLHVRLEAHQKAAVKVAEFLEVHPKVERVLYPALKSHPQCALFEKQMTGSTGLMSFFPKDADRNRCIEIANRLKYFYIAVSWGGYESLVYPHPREINKGDPYARFYGLSSTCGLRIHVGTENTDCLLEDIDRALR